MLDSPIPKVLPNSTAAELEAAMAAYSKVASAIPDRIVELNSLRKAAVLERGRGDEVASFEARIAEANLDLERATLCIESIKAQIPEAKRADARAAILAEAKVVDGKARALNKRADEDYAKLCVELASIASADAEYRAAASAFGRMLARAEFEHGISLKESEMPARVLTNFSAELKLPALMAPGDNGNDLARKRYWPAPWVPSAALAEKQRLYGPAKMRGYEVRVSETWRAPAAPGDAAD